MPSAVVSSSSTPENPTDGYERICGICFTNVHPVENPRARLNSCDHLFCAYCIKEWAKKTNVCPSCKARFTRLYVWRPDTQTEEETKVRKRNYAGWVSSYYDGSDEEDEDFGRVESQECVVCDVCRQSQNAARMIFCDQRQCTYAAHLDCLGLAERPLTFLCACCAKLREEEAADNNLSAEVYGAGASSSSTLAAPTIKEASGVALASDASRTGRGNSRHAHSPTPLAETVTAPYDRRHLDNAHSSISVAVSAASPGVTSPTADRSVRGATSADKVHRADTPRRRGLPSSSERTTPSSPCGTPTEQRRIPVDFSKPQLHLRVPGGSVMRGLAEHHTTTAETREQTPAEDDDYYFLSPSSHSVAAAIEFKKVNALRAAEARTRRQRERAKAERLHEAYGVRWDDLVLNGGQKRPRSAIADGISKELESLEQELTDHQQRRIMEERMVRKWAADILPVLRQRRYVEGDTVTTESDLLTQATTQARKMVREKMDAKSEALRRQREKLVRAQAQREAAALAKLARIIAQHRERQSGEA